MTLQEMKEVRDHARRLGLNTEYKRLDVFNYVVHVAGEDFTSKKKAVKAIDKYDEDNGAWNKFSET